MELRKDQPEPECFTRNQATGGLPKTSRRCPVDLIKGFGLPRACGGYGWLTLSLIADTEGTAPGLERTCNFECEWTICFTPGQDFTAGPR